MARENKGMKFFIQNLKKQEKYSDYFREWKEREFVGKHDEDKLWQELENLSEQMGMRDSIIIASYDYRDLSLAFFTENVSDFTGFDISFLKEKGIDGVLAMIHPDDRPEVLHFQKIVLDTFHSLSEEEKKTFEWTYTVRFVHQYTGEVKWYYARVRPYHIDDNGNIVFDLHIIIHLNTAPKTQSYDWGFSYTSCTGKKVFVSKNDPKPKEVNLTKKEKEVALMMMEGLSSEEIADRLFISINTVYTHRKNIWKKINAKNLVDMMRILASSNIK